jgi:hypothetical protein
MARRTTANAASNLLKASRCSAVGCGWVAVFMCNKLLPFGGAVNKHLQNRQYLLYYTRMNEKPTIADYARKQMHNRLMAFCRTQKSINFAAGLLDCNGLSVEWIKGFASGKIRNPTVDTLKRLELRLDELEKVDRVA